MTGDWHTFEWTCRRLERMLRRRRTRVALRFALGHILPITAAALLALGGMLILVARLRP